MADTLTTTKLMETKKRLVVAFNIQSDGTGTTDGVVVDKSTLTGPNGLEPGKLVVERMEYEVDGMQLVFEFDHTADDIIATAVAQGYFDFTHGNKYQGFVDPASSGATGDIVVTTVGHTAGDKGSVIIHLRKKD